MPKPVTGFATAQASGFGGRQLRDSLDFAKGLAGDALKGFVADLRSGTSAADALRNALDRISTKILDKLIDAALSGLFSDSGGGIFASLFGGVQRNADGGWIGGKGTGRSDSNLSWVSRGEHITNAKSALKHAGLLDAINADRLPSFANGGWAGMSMPSVPPGLSRGGGMKVVVQNTQSDMVEAKPQTDANGDLTLVISAIKADIAQDLLRGQGAISQVLSARQTNQHRRG